ncbi:MAG TPA: hypothetical protein DDZ51_07015, partial [Planctomycetaceae bacterium]|nr:hypothetical protein [Planctomycetaceae bacterium]
VDTELAKCDQTDTIATSRGFRPVEQPAVARQYLHPASMGDAASSAGQTVPAGQAQRRAATAAQIKALHTIASRAGLTLASELQQQCGVSNPQQLTIQQASRMIDHLKQSLTPTPA